MLSSAPATVDIWNLNAGTVHLRKGTDGGSGDTGLDEATDVIEAIDTNACAHPAHGKRLVHPDLFEWSGWIQGSDEGMTVRRGRR